MEVPPFLCLSGGRCAQGPRACGRGRLSAGQCVAVVYPMKFFRPVFPFRVVAAARFFPH